MLVLLFSVIAVGCMALDLPKLMRKRRVPDLSVYFIFGFWVLVRPSARC